MNKKSIARAAFFVLLVAVTAFVLSACSLLSGLTSSVGNSTTSSSSGSSTKKTTFSVQLHNIEGYSVYDFIDKNTNIIKMPGTIPVREGYDFVEWCSDEECTEELPYGTVISFDLDIYPHWEVRTYTVTLVNTVSDESEELTVSHGESASLTDPQIAGYTFTGWYTDKNCREKYNASTRVTYDFTLYTGWEVIRYAIYYHTDGGEIDEDAAESYTMFDETQLPFCAKVGYQFAGWYDNAQKKGSVCTSIQRGQQGEKNYYAKYVCVLAEATPAIDSVELDEDTISFSVRYEESIINPETYLIFSQGATYTLTQNESEITTLLIPRNNGESNVIHRYTLTVTAENGLTQKQYELVITQFTSHNVTINYYSNNALYFTDVERYAGDRAVELNEPMAPNGYVFSCWLEGSLEGEEYDFGEILVGDLDLYALFTPIQYDIEYSLGYAVNGENPATYTVEDAVLFLPAVPTSEEYDFEGWYDSDDYTNKVTGISVGSIGKRTFYAAFTLKNKAIKDFVGREEITKEELADFFVYAFYYRLTELPIKVTGGTEGEEIGSYIESARAAADYVDGMGRTLHSYPTLTANAEGVWDMSGEHKMLVDYKENPSRASNESEYPQVEPLNTHFSESWNARSADFDDFAINHITDSIVVEDSEQLVYAVERGYRPLPKAESVAEEIYEQAKDVLRTYISDDMSDYEKALAIYEYIITYISYDHDIYDKVTNNVIDSDDASKYYCFYLDGVFNAQIAVCDGYSKAFMLMCRMEGIRAVQIEGRANEGGTGHAWNKVCLSVSGGEREWYVVDSTSGDTLTRFSAIDSKEVLTHAYFLFDDEKMAERYTEEGDEYNYVAESNGNYYGLHSFTIDNTVYSYSISSDEQMAAFMNYLIASTLNNKQISLDVHICLEDDRYDPFTYNGNREVNGIRMEILQEVGVVINSYNITWVSTPGLNAFSFLCSKK